nr:YcdB/YcdC domain-containing protein [uncultured Methanoregula sp.]
MRIPNWKLFFVVAVCCLALVSTAAAFQVNWSLYKAESQIPNVPSFENAPAEPLQPGQLALSTSGQYPITQDEAKKAIQDYTGQPKVDPVLYRIDGLPVGSYYRMYVNASEYAVNQQTGKIEFVHMGENTVNSTTVNLTRDEAYDAAKAYANQKDPEFSKKTWNLVREGLYERWWDNSKQYYFTWREISGNVLAPSVVHVAVNPHNGKIIDFWDVERTINVSLTPGITLSEALESSEDYYSWLQWTGLEDEYLSVITRSTNVQTLMYNVKMNGIYHYRWGDYSWPVKVLVFVDGQNGNPMSYWDSYVWPEDWIGF